tara:strand:- start:3601 stop:4596 length:996 start_codon:yes stop_codon:yes gene_type:complete
MSMQKVFLFCTERSGSNLLTKLMNSHSEICGPSTKHLLNPTFRNLHRYEPLNEKINWNEFLCDLLDLYNVDFSSWNSSLTKDELLHSIDNGSVAELFHYIFDKETKSVGKKICFIKEIKLYEIVPHINFFIPSAKFVYMVRDPRDMALSWKKSRIHKGGIVEASQQWKIDQQQYLKFFNLENKKEAIKLLRYEDLISNPKEELSKIFSFLKLNYEPVQESFYKDAKTQENSKKNTAWANISKGLIKDNKAKYKTELHADEIAIIEHICRDEMRFFNYHFDNTEIDLQNINPNFIKDKAIEELNSLPYSPPESVIDNMKAKKVFYQKIIFNG